MAATDLKHRAMDDELDPHGSVWSSGPCGWTTDDSKELHKIVAYTERFQE